MNLPAFALDHKAVVIAIALILFGAGLLTFLDAPRREDPEFVIREAIVLTAWPGATADEVERLVSDPIERAAANLKQVRRVQSWSYPGRSVVQVSGTNEVRDVRALWTKLRAELARLQPELPPGATPPIVDDNFGDTAAMILALHPRTDASGNHAYTPRELEKYAKRLRDHLMDLRPGETGPGGEWRPITTEPAFIARMDMFGLQDEVVYLETDAATWSKLDLSVETVSALLEDRNRIAAAGTLNNNSNRLYAHVERGLVDADALGDVVVERIATGAESPAGQTLTEFSRRLEAGLGAGDARPPSFDVPVRLRDLGIRLSRGYADPPAQLARFGDGDGSVPAVMLSFTMKPGENISELGEAVDRLLSSANDTFLPPDLIVTKVSDPPHFVNKKVEDVISNLQQAIGLVLLILGLLAGPRVAIVTAASIPLIMLSAVALMRIWNVEIEQISLAALIVALGLLVDNAIVTCENTTRYLNEGRPRRTAVIDGCNLVGGSLLWSSLTTIGVFIPMAFALPGDLGEYIFSLPVVVTITLLVSWLCAMTLTPILNYYLLKPESDGPPLVRWLQRAGLRFGEDKGGESRESTFASVSRYAIRHRLLTIGMAFGLLAAALLLPVKPSFFPDSDRPQLVIDVHTPATASVQRTDAKVKAVEELVQRLDEVTWRDGEWVPVDTASGGRRLDSYAAYVGTGGPRFYTGLDPGPAAPNYGFVMVNARDRGDVAGLVADLRRAATHGIGKPDSADYLPPIVGARVVPHALVMGTPVTSPIQYRIMGPRLAEESTLRIFADRLKQILEDSGRTWDVHDSWGGFGLQLDVAMDPSDASIAGVTHGTVAESLDAYFSGRELTSFREQDKRIPVRLRLSASDRHSIDPVRRAWVEGYETKVPLAALGSLGVSRQASALTRYQRQRSIYVMARPQPGFLPREILAELQDDVDALAAGLPPGYWIEHGGIEEEASRGERANSVALNIGLALVVLCLVLQYNSFVRPLLIVLTVPLAVTGGMLGLWVRGIPLGFMETLGFLALFGTVLNAAILLIDFIEQLIRERLLSGDGVAAPGERAFAGLTREAFRECLAEAGRARLQPIFMTTATTVAGLMSLMFGGGPLFAGLATVFAIGLVFGSAITLLVLPALIALFVENFGYEFVQLPAAEEGSPARAAA